MKRIPPRVRPASKALGRSLVAQSNYRDLLKRHEAVTGLVARARTDLRDTENDASRLVGSAARKLELTLPGKRTFLKLLEERLKQLDHEIADHERVQLDSTGRR